MRLKSLTIKGFKSFANETVLNFNDNVIGVVGPNGSGKSNIVDAIRWVLGEQKSRELRLDKMSDIIFNGTKTRKESGLASVTLTFENTKNLLPTEYQTVSISRILYRSGESEYRLNNVACRLKDIRTLFIDTGVGSNSYAIIALGMVDDILDDKENARRKMFEQAAGISKYKTRKKETLSKLKITSADLDRIEDLLFEIEGNMKMLERQARRTQKYFDLKEKYKDLSVQYAVRSSASLKNEFKAAGDKLKEEQQSYAALDVDLRKYEAELEEAKKNNLDKEEHLSSRQRALNELVNTLRNQEGDKDLQKQKIVFKEQNIQNYGRSIEDATVSLKEVESQIAELSLRMRAEKDTEQSLTSSLAASQTAYEEIKRKHASAKQSNDARVQHLQELEHRIFDLEKRAAVAHNTIDNLNLENQRFSETINDGKLRFADQKKQKDSFDKDISHKQKVINSLQEKEEKRQTKIERLQYQLGETKDQLTVTHRKLDARQNEYDLLKSMIDSYEGFPESVKFLSNNWKKDIPILSDLLDVEESYKAVIEQYLESYLNHYIVQDIPTATSAIKLLKEAQKGKANFFLLDRLPKVSSGNPQLPNIIAASSVVHVEDKYKSLLDYLLKDVFIYEGDIEELLAMERNEDITLLSQDGSIQLKNLSIRGGSVGLFEGKKIGRKKNLEKLEKSIKKSQDAIQKLESDKAKLEDQLEVENASGKTNDISLLKREIAEIEQNALRVNIQIENYQRLEKETLQKIEENKLRINELEINSKSYAAEINDLKSRIEQAHSMDTDDGGMLDVLADQLSQLAETFNSDNVNLIRHQNLLANLNQDLEYKQGRQRELEEKKALDGKRKVAEETHKRELEDAVVILEEALIKQYKEKEAFEKSLNEEEQKYYAGRNSITEMEERIRQLARKQNQIHAVVTELKEKYTDLRFQMSSVGDRLKIEFGVELKEVLDLEFDESIPLEELTEKVERMKIRLSNFGEINPLAVEAFNEMKERYDSISVQRQDILDAKESLLQTINEIEQTATNKFMEAFENVRTNFIEVFRSLFTEDDNCNLILLDPDNPLDSKIEIIAKPKGKKPISLSQLSGGEKTLTATALLFALYLLKPAPFCIFDEVDAPLDDANIQKFNKIVKKFSEKSQFIIVTHNKSTMAEVDVLYGVYMQEQGVSGVSPVDFRYYKHEPVIETVAN